MMRALILIVVAVCSGCAGEENVGAEKPAAVAPTVATFVGSEACKSCHASEYEAWQTSHHRHAMQPAAVGTRVELNAEIEIGDRTTRFTQSAGGDVVITTDDVAGPAASFPVVYAFGTTPLQQFLVDVGGGKLQATSLAWDSRPATDGGQRWFELGADEVIAPDDVLHWTQPSHNWNFMCADCHSTALKKNYDVATRTYATTFAEVTVGCEACHGPSSKHLQTPEAELPLRLADQSQQINNCAPCHSRRSQLAEGFSAGADYFDYYLPSLLDPGLYHADGQILDEVYVYGSFLQSKMHQQGVKCSDCHEPHSGQTRFVGNALCTQCHNETGRVDFPTLTPKLYDSQEHHLHSVDSDGAGCISCHMADATYMLVDPRRDHSFRIPRPDLTQMLEVPNACNQCHIDKDAAWAADVLADRFGAPDLHYGMILAGARAGEPPFEQALAQIATDVNTSAIVRATALSLTAGYSRRMTSTAIEAGLMDPNPLVRIGALRGAERWVPDRRWRQTKRLLEDEVLAVRIEAARILMPVRQDLAPADQRLLGESLDAYLKVASLTADRAEGQTNIALVHLARNDIAAAEASLIEAMKLNPQWVPALVNLADLYRASGRDVLGGDLLAQALQLVPANGEVLVAQALWLVRQNRTDEALPLLKTAWQVSQETRFAYVYAVALNGAADPQGALAVLDAALSRRADQQLLQTAFSIARDAGLNAQAGRYAAELQQQ